MSSADPCRDDPFVLSLPKGAGGPFVFSSPHSGRQYPESFKAASRLDEHMLRRSEDCYVDALFADAPKAGAALIAARYPRAFVDLNREPWELDPLLFGEPLPAFANSASERVAAGLGTIARVVASGIPIYDGPIPLAEAERRIERIYRPYHARLRGMLGEARRRHGWCVLVDCHSMPSHGPGEDHMADIVLGDRFGESCDGALTEHAETLLTGMGYRVVRNHPYAGGFCTGHYGRPDDGRHAVQIEIRRSLYMNEATLAPTRDFECLARDMGRFVRALATFDLAAASSRLAAE